jgi:hypothetical protein
MLPGWWLSPFETAALRPPQGDGNRVRSPPAKSRFNSQTARSSLRATGSRECAPDDRLREAIHLTAEAAWIASSQVLLAMTRWVLIQFSKSKYAFAISRHDLPEVCGNLALRIQRAQGKPGARCTRGLVCKHAQKHAHEHTGSAESIRPSLRNGFTAYNALFPATGLIATVIPKKRWLLTNLTPASGRQNHTPSPSASAALVSRSFRVHRISTRVS